MISSKSKHNLKNCLMKLISRLWKLCLNEDYDQGAFLKPKLNLILKKKICSKTFQWMIICKDKIPKKFLNTLGWNPEIKNSISQNNDWSMVIDRLVVVEMLYWKVTSSFQLNRKKVFWYLIKEKNILQHIHLLFSFENFYKITLTINREFFMKLCNVKCL